MWIGLGVLGVIAWLVLIIMIINHFKNKKQSPEDIAEQKEVDAAIEAEELKNL